MIPRDVLDVMLLGILEMQIHVCATDRPGTLICTHAAYGAEALKGVLHHVKTQCPGILLHICNSAGAFGISTRDAAEVRVTAVSWCFVILPAGS